ncbi:hypothetical protein FH972_015330 [Carpinus fangiana]|uniref:Uncharacterized protein n=1 Tax=Carpinus fangiana TaxID=176857 RepID=A0A5N6REA0_9ROSI|nr:hypothetical protein FH972_015330 [Carpinus fangiana]
MENVRRLSAEQVMRVAEKRFIHFSSQNCADDHVSIAAPSGLSCQETKDVELARLLLASAEKISKQEFVEEIRLLNLWRIAALKGGLKSDASYHEEKVYGNPTLISCYLHLPFSQSIALMQAPATRQEFPVEILKITVVGTTSRQKIEETGNRLARFAETLNLPFSFRTVMVRDIKDLNKDMFETKADEVVAVNFPFLLNNMITKPSCLESLIKVLRDINPCVMVITEVDADHNSPTFLDRFHEALLFYCALFFESLEVCMDQSDANRMALEATYSSEEIVNIVAAEGEDRVFRRMKFDAWRALFARFGMVEQELA